MWHMSELKKPLIIVPTYNERENVQDLFESIKEETAGNNFNILIVDSASPDGTADLVLELQKSFPEIHLLRQNAKLGLGKAYLDGMQWALQRDYDCIFTMGADFSHHPRYLKPILEKLRNYDLVVGSRYVKGGKLCNWPRTRRWLSRFSNWYAKTLIGLPFFDLTSGFHCFRSELLRSILRYNIHSEGYAFLIELKFLTIRQGGRAMEYPIIFSDRERGESKISKRVILESVFFVLKFASQRKNIQKQLKKRSNGGRQNLLAKPSST